MIERYLKAKHWQVFLLTFALPFVVHIVMTFSFVSQTMPFHPMEPGEVPEFQSTVFLIFGTITLLYVVFLFGWYWSVAIGLKDSLPKELKLKYQRFKIFFYSPLIYFCLFGLFIYYFAGLIESNSQPDFSILLPMLLLLFILHFYSIFCIVFIMYFTAKTIRSVEIKREAHFSDYILYFFLIWFFPIGVWILQPKINDFVSQGNGSEKLLDD
jgi:hypothetical protein